MTGLRKPLCMRFFSENRIWCLVDKPYHRANWRSSFRPIARFAVELQSFVCDCATPSKIEKLWSKGVTVDIRVFNPFAPSYRNTALTQCYHRNELEKRRAYDERIREVEHGSFSPLVFSAAGGMGATANVVYKRIASLIADKHNKPYSKTMNWLRCRLSFSLLRSAVMCLRGSRSSLHHPISSCGEIDLAMAEGQGLQF